MSTGIFRRTDQTVVARTICDDCQSVMSERTATEYESTKVGTCTLVCDWCAACAPKHQFPLDVPWYTVRGMSVGNPAAIAKVRITTDEQVRR